MSFDRSPTTDAELADDLRELIEWIEGRRDGGNIPLAHDDQARFIQAVFARAQSIYNSEPFLRSKVVKSLGDYVGHESKKKR